MATYGTALGVEALVPAIGPLYGSNTPTATHVDMWLEQGAAVINRALAGAGYSVPVEQTALVFPELAALNELYAAAYAVMARGLDVVSGGEENRSALWMQQFNDRLAALAGTPLPDVPMTVSPAAAGRRLRLTRVKRVDAYSRVYDDLDVDT